MAASDETLAALEPFVGEWSMASSAAPEPPRARTTFEWLPGRRFLVQRWEVDHDAAPDGIAVIGLDESRGTLLQHSFDSRGVARVYEMGFVGGIWTLSRAASPPDFSQRFRGAFSDDGDTISGTWESSADGSAWARDFDLVYTRVR